MSITVSASRLVATRLGGHPGPDIVVGQPPQSDQAVPLHLDGSVDTITLTMS